MKIVSFDTNKNNVSFNMSIIPLMMFILSLCMALLALLSPVGFAQTKADTTPPVIEVKTPRNGERYVLPEYSLNLSFTITDDSLLKKVAVEVIGENTGTFFTVCGEDQPPCKGNPRVFNFDLYSPVFIGKNTLKIFAADESENLAEASIYFYVSDLKSGTLERLAEPVRVPVPTVSPAKLLVEPLTSTALPRETYTLLILCHDEFKQTLQLLVQHKNNTGMPTILLSLEQVYEIPEFRGVDHAETIKKAIAEAKRKWQIKYVMIVGDSDKFPIRYTKVYDLGYWGDSFAASDLYYADLYDQNGNFDSWDFDHDNLFGEMQGNFPKDKNDLNQDRIDLIPDVAVGRVPASNKDELEIYVNKVINYENNSDWSWFKRGLLITGDYPNSNATNDLIASQLQSRAFQIIKMYHNQVWPTTNLTQRRQMIESEVNAGVGFISYVGHGAGVVPPNKDGGVWGGWYSYDAIPFLNNPKRLPVIFSAACDTAMFHSGYGPYFAKWGFEYKGAPLPAIFAKYRWAPEPIAVLPASYDVDALAEHFLVKGPMGGIAFIGSYTGTQPPSHTLARYFFEAYASGTDILGDLWNAAIRKFVTNDINQLAYPGDSWYTAAIYHHIHKMLLMGDPSLRLAGVLPDLTAIPNAQGNFCNIENGKLVVTVRNLGPGVAGPSTTQVDFFRYGKVSVATPSLDAGKSIQLIFDIPRRCFDPDCNFRIIVDAVSEVHEANEGNNIFDGSCMG